MCVCSWTEHPPTSNYWSHRCNLRFFFGSTIEKLGRTQEPCKDCTINTNKWNKKHSVSPRTNQGSKGHESWHTNSELHTDWETNRLNMALVWQFSHKLRFVGVTCSLCLLLTCSSVGYLQYCAEHLTYHTCEIKAFSTFPPDNTLEFCPKPQWQISIHSLNSLGNSNNQPSS